MQCLFQTTLKTNEVLSKFVGRNTATRQKQQRMNVNLTSTYPMRIFRPTIDSYIYHSNMYGTVKFIFLSNGNQIKYLKDLKVVSGIVKRGKTL